ncbi:ESX secretion-associated protein EspG [Nocardia sp. NPDC057455]|uniref:ESX secretion-associated protein EspG n=1 Tax=Nocardia sp. NPDC057455 TaxID=3346138 RepID=UPI00366F57D7
MTHTWKFTDLEFVVLWEDFGEVGLPRPFSFTSRTPLWDDYLAEKARTRAALLASSTPARKEMLDDLYRPDIRLRVLGFDGRDYTNVANNVRLMAARRADRGYLVTQLPGETVGHSGGFAVTECAALELADAVVRALPEADSGKRADIVLADENEDQDLDYGYGASAVHDSFQGSVHDRSADFRSAPAERFGFIDVIQAHSMFGPRGMTRHRLKWRDLVDDGRYLIDDGHPPVATAADGRRLVSMINARIAEVVRAIKDERG